MDLSQIDRKRALIAGGVIVSLLVGGTAFALTQGAREDATSSTTSSTSSSTAAPKGPTAPLTGLPQSDESLRTRPVLTVKVDNSPKARPQFGIDRADAIVEEKVEGGISRFMALFQSQDSDRVGPVRSLRSTDVAWLRPVGGLIAYSGGIPPVKAQLGPAGLVDIGADNHGPTYYKRRNDRPFEQSQYTITSVLRTLTPANTPAAKALYSYRDAGTPLTGAGMQNIATVQGKMGADPGATTYAWTWDANSTKFLRTTDGKPHSFEGVGQIAMPNVIIQYTRYQPTQFRDRANAVVDEAITTGDGDALILSDGKAIQGRWSRSQGTDVTTFYDQSGVPVKLTAGQTWLHLVPSDLRANLITG